MFQVANKVTLSKEERLTSLYSGNVKKSVCRTEYKRIFYFRHIDYLPCPTGGTVGCDILFHTQTAKFFTREVSTDFTK